MQQSRTLSPRGAPASLQAPENKVRGGERVPAELSPPPVVVSKPRQGTPTTPQGEQPTPEVCPPRPAAAAALATLARSLGAARRRR